MHTVGLVLTIFGGIFFFASAVALSCTRGDEETSVAEAFEVFLLGGILSFFRDLFRAIAEGIRDRSSAAFPPLVLLVVGVSLLVAGCLLLFLAAR